MPMKMKMTSKGQVTIPKQIRDALNLNPGCSVVFDLTGSGDVVIHSEGWEDEASSSEEGPL